MQKDSPSSQLSSYTLRFEATGANRKAGTPMSCYNGQRSEAAHSRASYLTVSGLKVPYQEMSLGMT